MQNKKSFIAGTFDNFHVGHQYLLSQVAERSEHFVVVVARDKTVERIKGRKPVFSEMQRKQRVEQERYTNAVVKLGRTDADFFQTIAGENPDVLFLGYDQRFPIQKCQERFPDLSIIRLKPFHPDIFKSSKFWSKSS